jgi:hypothetical protein
MKYALLAVILLSPTFAAAAEPDAKADWWSLRKLTRPEPPAVKLKAWVRNPIDAFVLAALEARGLQPAAAADKATLLRRVTFDLIGLPPTPEEIDAFLKDDSPDAYAKVVDRLLASPHYGERWARHWLDVARFSESQGFEYDRIRDHAWRYRDYVVESFNEDKSYPQFVKEQIAGDMIEPVGPNGIIATGFLTAGPWDEAGNGSVSKPLKARIREEELEDIIGTVGQTFMGLTVNCARCHNHKFDPIEQKDYYRFKAVFEGVRYGNRPISTPKPMQLPPLAWCAVPSVPPPTFLLRRGDVDKPGEQVVAGGLSAIKAPAPDFGLAADAPEGTRRLKLAEWLTNSDNPLPARVMVNRIWHYHFGRGIVASPNDFGFNGERPTHPELLDWLASEFIARGWSVKKLHKLLVTSATYQQSSAYNAKAAEQDADDRYLWRFAPRRLEGEAVRDAMLSVSGQLNPQVGGPSFRPFTVTVFNSAFYTLTDSPDPEQNRRTLYRINVESAKSPLLEAFDCPDPSTKTPRRAVTTTPLQALTLMNNSFVLRQARCFGDRVRKEAGNDADAQVRRAYLLAFGRPPTKDEMERAAPLAKKYGPEMLCWVLLNSSEFLYLR